MKMLYSDLGKVHDSVNVCVISHRYCKGQGSYDKSKIREINESAQYHV